MRLYKYLPDSRTLKWPNVPRCEYVKLTLVKEEDGMRYNEGNFQNLDIEKTVELENILTVDSTKRKLIVIEGVAGIGKSTFVLNVCQRWANQTLFQGYKYVILVELHDPTLQSAKSLSDILPCRNRDGHRDAEAAKEAAEKIVDEDGENTLFIFDGWDVFPLESRKNSLICEIIFNPERHAVNWSTIVITSRPDSSSDLHCIASSKVRIFGFTPVEVKEYFTKTLKDSSKVDRLVSHLYKYPSLHSSCYIPLNAAIIVHIFCSHGETFPRTLHDAFCMVVKNCIKHYVSKVTPERELTFLPHNQSLPRYKIMALPSDLKEQLNKIALLAHKGSLELTTTLTEKDLQEVGLTSPFPTLGLLQSVESLATCGKSNFYVFMHSSIQQFLTALHVSQFTSDLQAISFERSFSRDNFSFLSVFTKTNPQVYLLTIMQYFAGFTELKGPKIREKVLEVVRAYKEVRHGMLILLRHNMALMRTRPFVSLVCCLHEAQNKSLCELVASQLDAEISLTHNCSVNVYECVSIGYLLRFFKSNEVVSVDLSHTYIDSDCIDLLCKEFSDCKGQICSLKLDLGGNHICAEGAKSITQLLFTNHLVHLDLSHNSISNTGANHIAKALQSNTSLLLLNLHSCGMTDEGIIVLAETLSKNRTLQELCLSNNQFTDDGLLILSGYLQKNEGLKILKINPDIDPRAKDLSKYIPTLSNVTIETLQLFVVALADCEQLTDLDIGEVGYKDKAVQAALKLVNEQRKEKDIQVMTLFCSEITLARFP